MTTLNPTRVVWLLLAVTALTYAVPAHAQEEGEAGEEQQESAKTGKFEMTAEGVRAGLAVEVLERIGAGANEEWFRERADSPDDLIVYEEGAGPMRWQVYVPEDYDPLKPPGVFVFVHAGADAYMQRGWAEALEERNMIFLSPFDAGNKTALNRRLTAGIAGIGELRERYELDENRFYLSGFSGGGRLTTLGMFHFPEVFTGGFPMSGADHFQKLPNTTDAKSWFSEIENLDRDRMRQARSRGRYVYFTTQGDFNREGVVAIAKDMDKQGFRTLLIDKEEGGHDLADAESLAKALDFMDAPLREQAAKEYEKGVRLFEAKRYPQAMEPLANAAQYGEGDQAADALAKLKEVDAKLQEEIAAVEAAIEAGDHREALRGIGKLRTQWRGVVEDEEVARLMEAARKAGG